MTGSLTIAGDLVCPAAYKITFFAALASGSRAKVRRATKHSPRESGAAAQKASWCAAVPISGASKVLTH